MELNAICLHLLAHGHSVLHLLLPHVLRLQLVSPKLLAVLRLHVLSPELLTVLRLHALGAELLTVLRLHALGAELLAILRLHVLSAELLTVLRLHALGAELLAVLRLHVLSAELLPVLRLHMLLPLGMHLNAVAVRTLGCEPLPVLLRGDARSVLHGHSSGALLVLRLHLHPRRRKSAAAVASAATATATAAHYESGLTASTTTMWAATAAAMTAVGACSRRGCDRQRGNARCEKHPGHHKFSFRTAKTDGPLHRSNA